MVTSREQSGVLQRKKYTHVYKYCEGVLGIITESKSFSFFIYLCPLSYCIHLKESAFPKTMHYDLPALIPINPRHSEIETESNAGKEQSSSPDALLPKSDGKQ